MRMVASRYIEQRPAKTKSVPSKIVPISAPLKGMSLSSSLAPGDPLLGPIVDNWVVLENCLRVRPGTKRILTIPENPPIKSLIPYYGEPQTLGLAAGGKVLRVDLTEAGTGFTSDVWSWTNFTNLSVDDYTILVNGKDGVWSWDGSGAMVKEHVRAPASETWIDPDAMRIVLAHHNRLWFADETNLAIFFLPLQSMGGPETPPAEPEDDMGLLNYVPLNAIFKRGGKIRAMYTWTIDGGTNLDDQMVVFTTNGEMAIFSGVDPETDFILVGVFRFDSPMSDRCVVNYGGELYVLTSTGLIPMSTMMRAESENLGKSEKGVVTVFSTVAKKGRNQFGWEVILDQHSGRMICNMPTPGDVEQMIRAMPSQVWCHWSRLFATCWQWIDGSLYFATADGKLYQMDEEFLNDDGTAITADVQSAWSLFKTSSIKQFKMALPFIRTDGQPRPYMDIMVDYDDKPPTNQPEISSPISVGEAAWETAVWDQSSWAGGMRLWNNWTGVGKLGRVGSIRMRVSILNCRFEISAWNVVLEEGSLFG